MGLQATRSSHSGGARQRPQCREFCARSSEQSCTTARAKRWCARPARRVQGVALGARGVLVRRGMVYLLGALGAAGVRTTLELIRRELDLAMELCRVCSVAEIDRRVLSANRVWTPCELVAAVTRDV